MDAAVRTMNLPVFLRNKVHPSGIVLLPHTSLADAVVEAERLRVAIEKHYLLRPAGAVTASIGVATSPTDRTWSAQHLVDFADLRLVVAKKRLKLSRDRVWAGQLPSVWHDSDARFREWPTLEDLPDYQGALQRLRQAGS